MKRLTSNRNVSEMGMAELAYNSCYRGGDGWARYRDYSLDIDARQLARMLLKEHADGDDSFTDGEDFEGRMMDYLQDGMDSREGLIALFYRNLWVMADLRERLKYYEDLEERLQTVYGQCDGLLKIVVDHLERHEGIDFQGSVHKARLLTDGEVDRWEKLKFYL